METVKVRDVKNGVVKEVKKSIASDYIGTGRFELAKEEKVKPSRFTINREELKTEDDK